MSNLRTTAEQQKFTIIGQTIVQLKANIETLEVIGFRMMEHPIAGLAAEIDSFHETLLAAEKRHADHVVKITQKSFDVPPTVGPSDKVQAPGVEGDLPEGTKIEGVTESGNVIEGKFGQDAAQEAPDAQ